MHKFSAVSSCVAVLSLLLAGPAFAGKPSGKPGFCSEKIAFIGLAPGDPTSDDLSAAQPMIEQLENEMWPARSLEFHYLTTLYTGANLDAVVAEMEAKVVALKGQGFNRIGLPPRSLILAPFILGTAGGLGGVSIDTRHPGVIFTVANPGTATVDGPEADSVFRFLDVPTINDLATHVQGLVGVDGQLLILYQESDAVSETVRDAFVALAAAEGWTYAATAITYNGSNFDGGDLTAARTAILALPAGSVVVHAVNGALTYEYTNDALTADLFVTGNGVRHFAGNYFPTSALPVPLELGKTLVTNPSRITERLGLPTKYEEWIGDPLTQQVALYLEQYGWLARCGSSDGLLDGFLEFDANGTSIQFQLERIYVPAGETTVVTGERRSNPRWYSDQYDWNFKALFGY